MYANRFFLSVVVLVIMAVAIPESFAQRTGNTGSGSTGTGNTGASGNSRASGNTGGGSTGSGGFTLDNFSLDSTGTTNSGNSGFIGGTGNTGFIGGGTGTAGRAQTMRNTTATRNNASRANMNAGNRMGGQGGGTSINTSRQVQPVYTLGFVPPTPDYTSVSSALSQRMNSTVQTGRLATVQLELSDGVAVVSGSVTSEYNKKVAENMVRLQPGVSEIQSDIQIEPSNTRQNLLSPSVRRNQQSVETPATTTPQGQPLVYVFESSRRQQRVEIPVTTTPNGRPLVHVF